MKLAFNVVCHSDQLWAQVLQSKYKLTSSIPFEMHRIGCSPLWKGLSIMWPSVHDSFVWMVMDGNSIDFWCDAWLGDLDPLIYFVADNTWASSLPYISVASMVDNNGAWKWGELEHLLHITILHLLLATMPPQHVVLEAELWEVIEGLKLAWESELWYVILEVDNLDILQLLSQRRVNTCLGVLFCTALDLLDHNWNVRICHISRTTNRVVDRLVKMSCVENACPLDEVSSNCHVLVNLQVRL
ncbi:hypothetical protein V6N13_005497 [Hibiscus sabdariffa]